MKRINLLFRRLWNNRLFTGLNILGLAIGICASWIVFRVVFYEFSFDKGHPEAEQIYKVYNRSQHAGQFRSFDGLPVPIAKYIQENITDVAQLAPIFYQYFGEITPISKEKEATPMDGQGAIVGTLPDYFEMVPYTWLAGSPKTIFTTPFEVVLTENRLQLYFPGLSPQEAMGRTIKYGKDLYTVVGVIANLERTSSFIGKEFMPIPEKEWNNDRWNSYSSNHQLYVKLRDEKAKESFLKIANQKLFDMNGEENAQYNSSEEFQLAPLSTLHFNKNIMGTVDIRLLYGLIGIALFLVLLASINYINLATAQVPYRAKEIGIRKTLGEQNKHLTWSFFMETWVICLLALALAWPLRLLMEQFFNSYLPEDLQQFDNSFPIGLFLLGLIVFISVLSAIYPAYLINRIQVAEVLKIKGAVKMSFGSLIFRKGMIVFQFLIAQVFVIATVIMGLQLDFLLSKDPGFKKDAILTLTLPYKKSEAPDVDPFLIKNKLQAYKEIKGSALGHLPMSDIHFGNNYSTQSDTGKVEINMPLKEIDDSYVDLFGIKILAGRNIALSDTSRGILMSRLAIEKLGFKSPEQAIGGQVFNGDKNLAIVGVVEDLNNKYLRSKLEPLVLFPSIDRRDLRTLSIRLSDNPKEWQAGIAHVEKEWKALYPKATFSYEFYDEHIKRLYESDLRFSSVINLSTAITILISCLGLIGLVTLTTAQRTKEIGIRKVLGSTVSGIVGLLSKDYLKLVLLSIVLASPIAWWAVHKWLESFAFKIDVSWWMFVIPALLTLLVAFFTMSYQSVKAARSNPVDSLRDE